MGIKGLAKFINKHSPDAISNEPDLKKYSGKIIAVDASCCMYQSLTAVGHFEWGETAHLSGIFGVNIRLLENGMRPVFVFDGRPPMRKSDALEQRTKLREKAKMQLADAEIRGDKRSVKMLRRRVVKMTSTHVQEAKELVKMLGIPYVEAPSEAEAQCASLVRAGRVYATATEDMDALTFGSNVLMRQLTYHSNRTKPVQHFDLEKTLSSLKLTLPQFVDLSILLGCDYCETIKKVGPARALELIYRHGNLEEIVKRIYKKAYTWELPENWRFREAQRIFAKPRVIEVAEVELKWGRPDRDAIVDFLCAQRNFREVGVRKGIFRLEAYL